MSGLLVGEAAPPFIGHCERRQFFWCLRSRFVTSNPPTTKRSTARRSGWRASLTSTPRPAAAST